MMRPILARQTTQRFIQDLNKNADKADGDSAVGDIQSSLASSVEELAMARSLYQTKEKKNSTNSSDDLGRLLQGDKEAQQVLEKVLGSENITQETVSQMLQQIKNDISKYQMLRFLLTHGDISASVYQFIYEELEKLKRKRKKLTSLDNIDSETLEMSENETISASQLQEIFLSFLEYQGHITPYYDDVYKKNKKKHNKIIKFISKMLNYEIFALSAKDDLDAFIYMTEKRRALNMLNDVYEKFGELNEFNDLEFIYSLLNNIDVEKICDKLSSEQVSKLVTMFNRVPQELFFSIEDKEEMLDTMKNNVTYRFKRKWI